MCGFYRFLVYLWKYGGVFMKINLSKITAEVVFTLKKYPVEACVFLYRRSDGLGKPFRSDRAYP